MKVEDKIDYKELRGASVMLTPGFVEDFEGNGVLDYCIGDGGDLRPHVVEYGYGGNEMGDMFTVVKGGVFTGVIRIFGSRDDEARYLNKWRMIHGGEFLHKDF